MATDADVPRAAGRDARDDSDHAVPATGGRADRRSAGESVERAPAQSVRPVGRIPGRVPESLYLTRIAVLEARVAALEATVARKECDLQHVVDRYEHVLEGRDAGGDGPLVDPARDATDAGVDCEVPVTDDSADDSADDGSCGDGSRGDDPRGDASPLRRVRALLR